MGFWSKLGKIGKIALPVVLAATGVGIPAAAAITAGYNVAEKKASGGSWKDALVSGATGAATSAIGGGALNALKGGAGAASAASNVGGQVAKQSFGSILGSVAKNPETWKTLGSMASGAAAGSAADRESQAAFDLNRYQLERGAYDKDLANAVNLPPALLKQVLDADVRQNFKGNASAITGAKTKEELDAARSASTYTRSEDATRAIEAVKQRALANLLGGPDATIPKAPVLPTFQKAGKGENLLGALGLGATAAGAFLPKQNTASATTTTSPTLQSALYSPYQPPRNPWSNVRL